MIFEKNMEMSQHCLKEFQKVLTILIIATIVKVTH